MDIPTIIDVAKTAKTSKSTVSRYLNGHKVKKETEEALKEAIEKLKYHPNINARRLARNNTQVIGIVVDDIANIFYADILRGIEKTINQNGYNCVFYSQTSNNHGEYGFMDLAKERQVDGLILVSFLKRSKTLISKIQELPVPVTLIGDASPNDKVFSVDVNNELGIRRVIHFLNQNGHKNIAYIGGPIQFTAAYWRARGYKSAMRELELNYNPQWIIPSNWTEEGGYLAMKKILCFDDVTAVVSSNDEMAIGALLCARELGYNVPDDLSIVGFDDIPVSKWVYPPLTSVKQPLYEMGIKVAEGLIHIIKQEDKLLENRLLIEPELIVRQSCRDLSK